LLGQVHEEEEEEDNEEEEEEEEKDHGSEAVGKKNKNQDD